MEISHPEVLDSERPLLSSLRTWLALALACALLVAVPGLTYLAIRDAAFDNLRAEGMAAAQSRTLALESILDRQRAVVAVLADDAMVKAALTGPDAPERVAVSPKLERLRQETQSTVLYLMDDQGQTIAASNWNQPDSFVGHDYSFRTYFRGALTAPTAMEFALGTVSREPGLYLSHVVREGTTLLGVAVVKVEFDALEAAWARSPNLTHVSDAQGRVIITTQPERRFAPVPPVPQETLPITMPVRTTGWTLTLLMPTTEARQTASYAAGAAFLAMLLLLGATEQLRRARRRELHKAEAEQAYRARLEQAVAERTRELSEEIRERQAAEHRLSRMQADLVQANKLATLGQITAGVAHEINQPLATIRLLAENGKDLLPAPGPAGDNLARITRMADRIGQITDQLRNFARKATGEIGPVPLRQVIDASLLLTASRRKSNDMPIHVPPIPDDLSVRGEQVRVEQILVNLLTNALEAQERVKDPWIRLEYDVLPDHVVVSITDNGPGLPGQIVPQLFLPFVTSKTRGLGLGLLISRDIARDFGGDLVAEAPQPDKGATFRLTLQREQ